VNVKQLLRGWGWLAGAGALAVLLFVALGSRMYLWAWLGATAKALTGAYIGYWVSRHLLRIAPSEYSDAMERALGRLARAIVVSACVLGFCLAV